VPTHGTRTEKVQVMTQQIAQAHERSLRDHSVDWHMMQPVWLADLDPSRRRTG
jgi:GH35 family endo-1,4-beta-xylanase